MLSAVEVVEWLIKHYSDGVYREAFGENYTWHDITTYRITPQEIVERIEKYETNKSCVNDCENCPKYDSFTDECEINMNCHLAYENDHEPKEEKKIKECEFKPLESILTRDLILLDKINELVDAINELRGV